MTWQLQTCWPLTEVDEVQLLCVQAYPAAWRLQLSTFLSCWSMAAAASACMCVLLWLTLHVCAPVAYLLAVASLLAVAYLWLTLHVCAPVAYLMRHSAAGFV